MKHSLSRRQFVKNSALAGGALGLLEFGLPPVSAADAKLESNHVRFDPSLEPLVRLLEDTPRGRVIEEFASRVKAGLSYREVVAALLLAGVRNIQPRPVGFKFHAVLVVNSAHQASLASSPNDRWLPIFWALDQFKSSQARDAQEGDWTMAAVDEKSVPPSHQARAAFVAAMDNWDEAKTDAATAGLARSAGAHELFELFCRYGARDFRDIGHKAIYVANSWRALQCIGWQHSEPVLRSLAYALLQHEGSNPARRDAEADKPWKRNLELAKKIRKEWTGGKTDSGATAAFLSTVRSGSSEDAGDQVIEMLNRGVAAVSIWDGIFDAAGELVMRKPGIPSIHAITTANALHYAFQTSGNDETRRMLLLQAAAFTPLFRGRAGGVKDQPIDKLETEKTQSPGDEAVEEIFANVSRSRLKAARQALGFLKGTDEARAFIAQARRLIFLKGENSHDYKFSSAVLEDYQNISPEWRNRYLAASVFWLRGSGGKDTQLSERIRSAIG